MHPHSLTLQLPSRHTDGRPSHHPQIMAFGGSESTENESWGRGYTRHGRRTIKRMLAAISQRNKPRAMSSLSGNEPVAVHTPTEHSLTTCTSPRRTQRHSVTHVYVWLSRETVRVVGMVWPVDKTSNACDGSAHTSQRNPLTCCCTKSFSVCDQQSHEGQDAPKQRHGFSIYKRLIPAFPAGKL